ncbi:MAG: nucleotidyltransferase domain-containing protein [Bacteroidota bacterium]
MLGRKEEMAAALQQYVAQIKNQPEVIGILATGSFVHGEIGPYSDVDVYVILAEGCTYRERGNTWIDGIEIEYFQNPPAQVRAYFRQEGNRPNTAHMLAHGRLLYEVDAVVGNLITEASALIAQPPAAWSSVQREFAKYGIDDQLKDYEDCLLAGDALSAKLIGSQIVEEAIRVFCGVHQLHLEKKKRVLAYVEKKDASFASALRRAIRSNGTTQKDVQHLVGLTETLLGGKRDQEWIMRGPLDLG